MIRYGKQSTTNSKFLSNFRHGHIPSSEMFWGGGVHHQLKQGLPSSPHELCMEQSYEIPMAQNLWSEVWNIYPISSDDLSHENILKTSSLSHFGRSAGYIHQQMHSRWTFKKSDSKLPELVVASEFWWNMIRSYCTIIAPLQSFKINSYSITSFWGGTFPFGSNMVTTHFRIQPQENVVRSQKVPHLWSRLKLKWRLLCTKDFLKLSEKSTRESGHIEVAKVD